MLSSSLMLLGDWDVRLDPWAVEYGGETPGAAQTEETGEQVDVEVERGLAEWQEIRPQPSPAPASLIFVDGVRRIESRLIDISEISDADVNAVNEDHLFIRSVLITPVDKVTTKRGLYPVRPGNNCTP